MTTGADARPDPPADTPLPHPTALDASRPVYWSIRRELWENRYLYIAPLIVAGFLMFTMFVGTVALPSRLRAAAELDPAKQQVRMAMPFSMVASVLIVMTYVVGAFYTLEALHGERRDRSILFWKSLPVSDLTTVLAKAAIPLVVLPLLAFGIILVIQASMLVLRGFVAQASGFGAGAVWSRVPIVQMTFVMIYGLIVHALWHAPLYGWLLLVSGWARRLPILWAVLPFVVLFSVERMLFQTSYGPAFLRWRLIGTMQTAFDYQVGGGIAPVLTPLRFLATPGLWVGLIMAALLFVAAVRLRRWREPI